MPEQTLSTRSVVIGGIVVVVSLLLLLLLGLLPRRAQRKVLEDRARQAALADSLPLVTAVRVARASTGSELALPGTLQANHDAALYARSSGYIRSWSADIGQRVKAGQVLAVIDAPDLDQQLSQANAAVANARAAQVYAKQQVDRWSALVKDSVVTADEYDQKRSAYDAAVATTKAATDNVARLQSLVGYEQVSAPFDGVVTARNVDNGVFISGTGTTNSALAAGGAQTASTPLYRVARIDTMRVYVGVPQSYAPALRVGLVAKLEAQELPGQSFEGRIMRTADAVDAGSRTLLTEVDVANRNRVLLPGMYADVHFQLSQPSPPILMPATALIFRTQGAQAAVVGSDSIAHFKNLRIGRDYGTVMEVQSGLNDGDLVINQPTDDLRDGQRVRVQTAPSGQPSGDQPKAQQIPTSKFRPPPQVEEGFPGSPGADTTRPR